MHTSVLYGVTFHYNSDYSGMIQIGTQTDAEYLHMPFKAIARSINVEPGRMMWAPSELPAIRAFVAFAGVDEAISKLESLDPLDALQHPLVKEALKDLTS